MSIRIMLLALVLGLFLPVLSWAADETWRKESGSTVLDNHLSPGECLYVRPTATGQTQVLVAEAIQSIKIDFNCNLAGNDTDCAVEVWWCPEGQATYSATVCKPFWFRNESGTSVKVFDGDESTGTGTAYGLKGPRWHINTTTHPGYVMEVSMCMDGEEPD